MAKERFINTRFWNDNFISELDPISKLLFIYFLTNEHTNISGIYEIPLKIAAIETGIDPSMFEKILPHLSPKIFYIRGWICIPNFPKHQHMTVPSVRQGMERELKAVPSHIIEEAYRLGYIIPPSSPHDVTSSPYLDLDLDLSSPSALAEKSLTSENAVEPTPPRPESPPSFDEWMIEKGFQRVSGPEMPDGSFPDVWGDEHGVRLPLKLIRGLTSEHKRLIPAPPKEIPVLAQNTGKLIEMISKELKGQYGSAPIFGLSDKAILSNLIKRTSFEFVKKYGKWFFASDKVDKKYKYGVKAFASNDFINRFIAETGISPKNE